MSAGYLNPKVRVLPVSGSWRFHFTNESSPWTSVQVLKQSGSTDATYAIFTSNFGSLNVPGYISSQPGALSGSAYNQYWSREAGLSGTLFTGSATDSPASAMIQLGNINSKYVAVEVSSSFGGQITVFPHLKSG